MRSVFSTGIDCVEKLPHTGSDLVPIIIVAVSFIILGIAAMVVVKQIERAS